MGKITFNLKRQASPGNDKSHNKCDLNRLVESSVTDFMMWLIVVPDILVLRHLNDLHCSSAEKGKNQSEKKQQLTRQDRDGKIKTGFLKSRHKTKSIDPTQDDMLIMYVFVLII